MIDPSTDFGRRAARRLATERIAWLTTVGTDGTPQPRPVWFLWDGESVLIYSREGTQKLRHIAANPRVALHLDGDGEGGDIVVLTGTATRDEAAPPANEVAAYVEKYGWGFERIQMTAAEFAAEYAVAIRMHPTALRGH